MSTLDNVIDIVSKVLEVESDAVSVSSGLGKTPKWDSMNHTKLVLELEDSFDVDFDFKELDKIITVEAIVSSLRDKGIED